MYGLVLRINGFLFHDTFTETNCSSLARSELGGQKDLLSNGAANANVKTEAGHQQGAVKNGISKTVVPPTAKTSAQMVTPAVADLLPKVPLLPENGDSKQKTEKEM